jgi:Zn-dependent membrane protease YugP
VPAIVLILIVGVLLVALPQIWIHRILDKHAVDRADLGGTGAEFARHALDALKLTDVKVEVTQAGNHYDPITRAVRLEPRFMTGRSLAAIVVAAHEIGHAMQHAMGLPMFQRRLAIAKQAHVVGMVGQAFVWSAPLLILIGKGRAAFYFNIIGFAAMTLLSFALQVTTLPVEFDASFKRALPLLERGRFLHPDDMKPARQLLRAAAMTYVAGLLRTIVSIPGLGPIWRR